MSLIEETAPVAPSLATPLVKPPVDIDKWSQRSKKEKVNACRTCALAVSSHSVNLNIVLHKNFTSQHLKQSQHNPIRALQS